MCTVLLADDEPLILEALEKHFNWKSMDCSVVDTALNGPEALEKLELLIPDILITDIVMPGKTGLDLIAWIREKKLATSVIILSAYDQFHYAQEALRMGAVDYLLKPLDKAKLEAAIQKAVGIQSETKRRPEQTLSESNFLFDIAQYGNGVLKQADPAWQHFNGLVVGARLFNMPQVTGNDLKISFRSSLEDLLKQHSGKCYGRDVGNMLLWIVSDTSAELPRETDVFCREMMPEDPEFRVCAACRGFESQDTLHSAWMDCIQLLQKAYFEEESGLLTQNRIGISMDVQDDLDRIREALIGENTEQLWIAFRSVRSRLYDRRDPDYAAGMLRSLIHLALSTATRMGLTRPVVQTFSREELNFNLQCRAVESCLREIAEKIGDSRNVAGRMRMNLEENYRRSDFSLTVLSETMGMSSSYLSKLFKKEFGVNFQDMLMNLRMDKAKELLLNTAMKNRDVAKAVGFEDERYFATIFRRQFGFSPQQFRIRTIENQNNQQI